MQHVIDLKGAFQTKATIKNNFVFIFLQGVGFLLFLYFPLLFCQVGEMLERPSAWPRFQSLREPRKLRFEIEAFVKEQGMPRGTMPAPATLADANRQDLFNAIRKAGELTAT